MDKTNVMSLFDGGSCGQLALQRSGINIGKYYASEIDGNCVLITQKHFPETVQLGNVTQINFNRFKGQVDLLIGGSPCQGFSQGGKRLNFEDERSRLFFRFVDALKEIQPKYFLLENVKMNKDCESQISQMLGVTATKINSNLFSAQDRARLYWTNIPIPRNFPKNNQVVKDILEVGEIEQSNYISTERVIYWDEYQTKRKLGFIGSDNQSARIYNPAFKSGTLCAEGGGMGAKTGLYLINNQIRTLTPLECERLQTLPDNYTQGLTRNQRYRMINNGWTVNLIAFLFSGILK